MALSPTKAALPPPPGVVPNLSNPKNHLRTTWLAGNIVCLVVPVIMVPLRLYVRRFIMKDVGWTDYLCLLAWALFIVLSALAFSLVDYGVGLHGWNVTVRAYSKFAEIINIQQIVYMPSILFTKVSILFQILQIFVPVKRTYRWYTLLTLIGLNAVFFTILFFLEIFQCVPRAKIWTPMLSGKCINISKTFVATAVINVCDDFTILTLPLFWIWKLKTSTRKKVGISLIFATGLFACISSVMRLFESIRSVDSLDITHALLPVSLWATAEVSSGLLVCCLPVIPRLFRNNTEAGSEPSYVTKAASTSISRKQYVEMDDLVFSQLPSTFTDIESQQQNSQQASDDMTVERRQEILKTVSIDQTSRAKT